MDFGVWSNNFIAHSLLVLTNLKGQLKVISALPFKVNIQCKFCLSEPLFYFTPARLHAFTFHPSIFYHNINTNLKCRLSALISGVEDKHCINRWGVSTIFTHSGLFLNA